MCTSKIKALFSQFYDDNRLTILYKDLSFFFSVTDSTQSIVLSSLSYISNASNDRDNSTGNSINPIKNPSLQALVYSFVLRECVS